jgi:hypothetical protein
MRTRGSPCQHLWIRARCRLEQHGWKSLADLPGRRPGRSRLYFLLPLEGLWSNLAYDLIGLSAVVAIVVGVRRHRPARPLIWWCFAAGQLLFVVGDVLYAVIDQVLRQSSFPSVADGFYLAGYPVLAIGLLILIRGRISGRDRAGLIDAAIIATGLCRPEPGQQLRRRPGRRRLAAVLCHLGNGRAAPLHAVAVRGRSRPGDAVLPPAAGRPGRRALYEAKHAGRDRIIVASEPTPTNVQPRTVPLPADTTGHTDDVPSDAVSDAP